MYTKFFVVGNKLGILFINAVVIFHKKRPPPVTTARKCGEGLKWLAVVMCLFYVNQHIKVKKIIYFCNVEGKKIIT
jgi:hypothetical protein